MSTVELQSVSLARLGRFFRSWIQDPLSIGAVAPSGRPLAKLMTRDLDDTARVVELGAGTGTVTQAIVDRGVLEHNLCIVEQHSEFIDILRRRFPAATTIEADACELVKHLPAWAGSVDFVVSGLPLVLFSKQCKRALLEQAFSLLGEGGVFLQFTYAGRCPVSRAMLDTLGLSATRQGVAAFNVPPAFVYRLERSGELTRRPAKQAVGI